MVSRLEEDYCYMCDESEEVDWMLTYDLALKEWKREKEKLQQRIYELEDELADLQRYCRRIRVE